MTKSKKKCYRCDTLGPIEYKYKNGTTTNLAIAKANNYTRASATCSRCGHAYEPPKLPSEEVNKSNGL